MASFGPLLLATIVNTTVPPTAGRCVSTAFVTDRSASVRGTVIALSVLFVRSGSSGNSDVIVATLS